MEHIFKCQIILSIRNANLLEQKRLQNVKDKLLEA